jgi:hypothetical protein
MNRLVNAAWIRPVLLLCALGAGGVMTQLVPSYQDIAAKREAATSQSREARRNMSHGVTGVDVDLRHLTLVGCIA